jgi:hypothetical protein
MWRPSGIKLLLFAGLLAMPAAAATEVLERIGLSRGVCVLPRCGDGGLALALATNSGMVVIAMDTDPARLAALRAAGEAAGVLGRPFWVVEGGPSNLLCADDFIDAIVVADAADAILGALPPAEIARALSPFRGRALVCNRAAPGALTAGALSNWLAQFNGLGVDTALSNDAAGAWALVRKRELPGSDWWPHRMRAADNNQVGYDTALRWPALTQYAALPYYSVYSLGGATAGGRHFEMLDWFYKHPVARKQDGRLRARSLYNGEILWECAISNNMDSWTQTLVAQPDALYVADAGAPSKLCCPSTR